MKSKHLLEQPLPSGIGKPALRALTAAGITNLDDVANSSEAQLAALHGVGPKAIGILKAALAAQRSQTPAKSRRRLDG